MICSLDQLLRMTIGQKGTAKRLVFERTLPLPQQMFMHMYVFNTTKEKPVVLLNTLPHMFMHMHKFNKTKEKPVVLLNTLQQMLLTFRSVLLLQHGDHYVVCLLVFSGGACQSTGQPRTAEMDETGQWFVVNMFADIQKSNITFTKACIERQIVSGLNCSWRFFCLSLDNDVLLTIKHFQHTTHN